MPVLNKGHNNSLVGFPLAGMMRYNIFAPRLYNLCKSLGFETGKIMPSRAFCSDENQGYPIILLAKHFGTFPFNHGLAGGIVATDRHGPYAGHGQDMVIIQASHVGYDPESHSFGHYHRKQTEQGDAIPTCGKIHDVINWYRNEYEFARTNISLRREAGECKITIDNQLLRTDREEGLLLHLDKMLQRQQSGELVPVRTLSTAKIFTATDSFVGQYIGIELPSEKELPIGDHLVPDLFHFKRHFPESEPEGPYHMERNLILFMPYIITSSAPMLVAAQANTQIEFDRTFRSIVKETSYGGKNLLFISGLHIDISPQAENIFPLTKFAPWAAYVQHRDGHSYILEQQELITLLEEQSSINTDQIDLEVAIQAMADAEEIKIS